MPGLLDRNAEEIAQAAMLTLPSPPPRSQAEKVAAVIAEPRPDGTPLTDAEVETRWADIIAHHPDPEPVLRSWRDWWARPEQLSPGSPGAASTTTWRWWAIVTGRGWGKTRTAAEWVLDRCEAFAAKGVRHRVAVVAPTAGDARDTCVEGESGLLAVCERRGDRAEYRPSKRRVLIYVNPKRPTRVTLFSAERPDRLRGPQHHTVWLEEFAAWPPKVDGHGNNAFTNAEFGLRLPCPKGLHPQGCVTTTPKPIPPVKDLLSRIGQDVVRTAGALYDNLRNLAPEFVLSILRRYEGTPLARQEVHGLLLDVVEGALWYLPTNELHRVKAQHIEAVLARIDKIVVGVDPYGGAQDAEAGIVVVGADSAAGEAFTLEDASMSGPSEAWGAEVVRCFHRWGAVEVVAESNYGGDMVRAVIQAADSTIPVRLVPAKKSKALRAQPVSYLAHQGRARHCGYFPDLESQQCSWVPGDPSPDRLDAYVYAVMGVFPEITMPPATATSPVGRRRGARWSGATRTRG